MLRRGYLFFVEKRVIWQGVKYAARCMLGYIPGVEMYHLTYQATYSRNVIITYTSLSIECYYFLFGFLHFL